MTFKLNVEYKHVVQALAVTAARQVPFVAAKTLSALALDGKSVLVKKLPVAFHRPTPFTLKGVYTKRAEKSNLVSEVNFRGSQSNNGRGALEYIRPGAQGAAARAQKKTEYLLTRAGWLPGGWVTVPGRFIMAGKLDGYGNMPGSYYKQIIRNLQIKYKALKPVGVQSQRRATKMGVANEFFAVAPGRNALGKGGGSLPPGVYRRAGAGGHTLTQYLKFVRKARYRQRLDVRGEVVTAVRANAQRRWDESVSLITDRFKAR